MIGRRPRQESRAAEFRHVLMEWKQIPESVRPPLRALARELGTSHQLLGYYLARLEEQRREADLERLRALAKAKNVTVTPRLQRRYLAWLRKIEAQQARGAAREAERAVKHAALLDRLGGYCQALAAIVASRPG